MRNLSVIDPPFLLGLGLVTVVVFAASWLRLERRWLRWTVRGWGLVLAVVMVASAVNARYAYLPTLAAVLGRGAMDQVSPQQLHQLELASGLPGGAIGGTGSVRLAIAHGSDPDLRHGVVVSFRIPPTHSHFHARAAEVYLPPAYFDSPRPRLPVLELLHGTPGGPADWTRSAFGDVTADEYASEHHGFAPVLVMPDVNGGWRSDSECVDGRQGLVQTYLTVDVRDAIITRFHTRSDARGWAIAGFSEGAYCSLQIGLRHPDLYSAIGDFSGEEGPSVTGGMRRLFTGTLQQADAQAASYDPAALLRSWTNVDRPPIWFEVGTKDVTLRAMARLDTLARTAGFATRFVVQQGTDHGFVSWRDAFRDSLPWFAGVLAPSGIVESRRT